MTRSSQERKSLHEFAAKNFPRNLKSKYSWLNKGEQLIRGAEVLLKTSRKAIMKRDELIEKQGEVRSDTPEWVEIKNHDLHEQASMLLAYGLENFFKGLWVAQNQNNIQNPDQLPSDIDGHTLSGLATKVNIDLNDKERRALQILTEYAVWRGRYPLPKRSNQQKESMASPNNIHFIAGEYPYNEDWPNEIYSIVDKIKKEFDCIS